MTLFVSETGDDDMSAMSARGAEGRGAATSTKGRSRVEERSADADIEFMINAKVDQAIYLLVERWQTNQPDAEEEAPGKSTIVPQKVSKVRKSNRRSGS
nr:hypothetical protein [Paracoccus saliphilus]